MMAGIQVSIPKGRIRSPWMGVTIPGERPIVLLTEQVRGALIGVTITDAAIIDIERVGRYMDDRRHESTRALEVTYSHGKRNRGRVVFYDRCATKDDQRILWWSKVAQWAMTQRNKRSKPAAPKGRSGEIARQIKRLEKERNSLSLSKRPPLHPLLPSEYRYEGTHCRDSERRWHDEKPQRKALARIAGMVIKNQVTATTGYKMLRDMGLDFKKFSEQPTRHGSKQCGTQDSYWRSLPKFVCGMAGNVARISDHRWEEEDEFTQHAKARVEYLATKRQLQTIDNQIAALRDLAEPSLVLTEPPPTNWAAVRAIAAN